MKKFLLVIGTVFITNLSKAQLININGKLIDKNGNAIENAIVSAYTKEKTKLLKTALTDSLGNFLLAIANYKEEILLEATFNKKVLFTKNIAATSNNISLKTITVENVTVEKDVTVVAQQNFITRKADRVIVNPDALVSFSSNMLEVIEKAPGIQVDIVNGTISMHGKPDVIIMINDKPTNLTGNDLANFLKSMTAANIAAIEIMHTPPANFDASGNAGIINIKLKRIKLKGYNGNVNLSYGQGKYHRSSNSINFNYRKNKVNFNSNVALNNNGTYQDLFINRYYFSNNQALQSSFKQNSYIPKRLSSANVKLDLDYYVTDKTVLGFSVLALQNKNKTNTENTATIADANNQLTNTVQAYNPSTRKLNNYNFSTNLQHKINKKGSTLSANADYLIYQLNTDQYLLNKLTDNNGSIVSNTKLVSNLPSNLDIIAVKLDYSTLINKTAKFETGLKTSHVNTNNIANFFDEINSQLTANNTFSNKYNYKETVNAAYVNYSTSVKKNTQLQFGLRLEQTNVNGFQFGNPTLNDSSFKRNYVNLFPTIFAMQPLDSLGKHVGTFSYGKRINRPNYQDMNPFTYPLDRYTLYGGNPFLNPTISHNFELAHTYNNRFSTSFKYSFTKDVIRETNEQRNGIFYSRPGNIGTFNSISLSHSANFKLYKKITVILYGELTNVQYKDKIYGENLNNKGTYVFINPTFQFAINKKWNAELSSTYQSGVVVGQFITIPVWQSRVGVSTKCLKDQGTIRFNLNDMFYTNQPGGKIVAITNSDANWKSYLDTRVASIAFGYRFNKGKSRAARQNTTAADTEKSRIN